MDWIEQLTGLDPDGGNGSIEALYVVALIMFAVVLLRWASTRWRSKD